MTRLFLSLSGALALWLIGAAAAPAMTAVYTPPVCTTGTFHSEPDLQSQRACMNVGVSTHGTEPGSYLFLTPDAAGLGIFRDNGALVWWKGRPSGTTEEHDAQVVHLDGRRLVGVWAGRSHLIGNNDVTINTGSVLLYNNHYVQAGQITAGAPFSADQVDMHEFRITPQGDALIGIYDPVTMSVGGHSESVVQYVIQKVSLVRTSHGIRTGKVLFQWESLQHVPVAASYMPDPGSGGAWDYFHGNAIDQEPDGNLILSARNTWGIYEISVKTGQILWQVGGRGDSQLRRPWCYQHDVTALGHDEYSVFDDGAVGPGCRRRGSWHPSRGLIFRVDPSRSPAAVSLVASYTHSPAIHSQYLGSMQRLSDGNVVVDWGDVPQITEFSANGRHVLMDLSLSYFSFRGFRYDWVGRPAGAPSVAAKLTGSGTNVWASWNGTTVVADWRVLGGDAPNALSAVTGPVRRNGFETPISVPGRYTYVAIEALDAKGQVLGTSKPVSALLGG